MNKADLLLYHSMLNKYAGLFPSRHGLIGTSSAIQRVWTLIDKYADVDIPVLITGKTGTGKQRVADAIYKIGKAQGHYVKVSCAAIPSELLESELFGYEKGAFTGAYNKKPGRFTLAEKGVVLLDEIGDLPLGLQAKLLQVVEDNKFSPLGSTRDVRVNTRILTSTNKDLWKLVLDGKFRSDLYFRLNVGTLHMPSLAEMKEDIPAIAKFYFNFYCFKDDRELVADSKVFDMFESYDWPGNIRQLENFVRSVAIRQNSHPVSKEYLEDKLTASGIKPSRHIPVQKANPIPTIPQGDNDNQTQGNGDRRYSEEEIAEYGLRGIVARAVIDAERIKILETLERVYWNRAEVARQLKISYKALLLKIQQCGLGPRGKLTPDEEKERLQIEGWLSESGGKMTIAARSHSIPYNTLVDKVKRYGLR